MTRGPPVQPAFEHLGCSRPLCSSQATDDPPATSTPTQHPHPAPPDPPTPQAPRPPHHKRKGRRTTQNQENQHHAGHGTEGFAPPVTRVNQPQDTRTNPEPPQPPPQQQEPDQPETPIASGPNSVLNNPHPQRSQLSHQHNAGVLTDPTRKQEPYSQCSTHEQPPDTHSAPTMACQDPPQEGPQMLLRKEVIQPHLPVRLPCYDLVPIASPTFDHSPHKGWAMSFGCYQLS